MKIILACILFIGCKVFATHKDNTLAYATLLEQQGNYFQAQHMLEDLQSQYPLDTAIAHRLGCFYAGIGNSSRALAIFKSLLVLSPENQIQVLYNIGYVLKSAGYIDMAIAWYHKALALDPCYEPAEFALGIAHLYKGDFEQGWKIHEKHLIRKNKNAHALREFIRTNTLAGKTILIRPEGGLGDAIQFIRYAKLLKTKGAYVITAAQAPLIPLISRCPYIDKVISDQDPLPPCHDWCSVMSLPAIFNATEKTIPRDIPYLYPDQALCKHWKQYIGNQKKFNIGICWQADVHNDSSRPPCARRGIPLEKLLALAQIPNVQLYSLQQKEGLEQLQTIRNSTDIIVFDREFDAKHGAFMDTAAVITTLNLVITVDTAVAHLAGALGTRVWLLLPYITDWRWIAHRNDSPWYPTMRIFKQKVPFNWSDVMEEVKQELNKLSAAGEHHP